MFGIFLFWIHYIIAIILLYHILKCIYIKGKEFDSNYYYKRYEKTDNDKKFKLPLWIIMVFIIILFIPILNLLAYSAFLGIILTNEHGSEYNKYYCKSLFTKKY